jgi:hypothetical protein
VIVLDQEQAATDFSDWRTFGEFNSHDRHFAPHSRQNGQSGQALPFIECQIDSVV